MTVHRPADPGAIDLETSKRRLHKAAAWPEIKPIIAAVEALRERVEELEEHGSAIQKAADFNLQENLALAKRMATAKLEAEEARGVELAGACRIVLAELPEDDEGIEIGNLQRLLCACRTALATMPAEALERARAVEKVIEAARFLCLKQSEHTWQDLDEALAKLDALGKEGS